MRTSLVPLATAMDDLGRNVQEDAIHGRANDHGSLLFSSAAAAPRPMPTRFLSIL
jgi:hypothetical protein